MAKKRIQKLEGADARYGWEIGCDGYVSATKAAKLLGKSSTTMSEWLNSEDRKKPGHHAYPIRAARPESYGPNTPWRVCLRSIEEHKRIHQPVEV